MSWIASLPTVNATLNSICTMLLLTGYVLIRRGRREAHRRVMLTAFGTSVVFLLSYLIYHYHHGSTPFPGQGSIRVVYFFILITHIVLAAVILPLILVTLLRGLRGELARHRRIARWTLPLWLYVSVTGVLIYLMLYRF